MLARPNVIAIMIVASATIGGFALGYALVHRPTSLLNRALSAYADYLDRRFRSLFLPATGRAVLFAQTLAIAVVAGGGITLREPALVGLAGAIAILPAGFLELRRQRRTAAIEAQTDGFVLALANALKGTPSVGDAFTSLIPIVAEPLRGEIALATKQMRLGCTLESVLVDTASRIGSRIFDTALASVLIGQRLGGNLARILETSAAALRELFRLEAMMRSKTSSGRIQMWIIAAAPVFFAAYFDQTQPGYFDPLTASGVGSVLLGAAIVCWVLAILIGRKVMAVDV
jgi:tight adherence protein B